MRVARDKVRGNAENHIVFFTLRAGFNAAYKENPESTG